MLETVPNRLTLQCIKNRPEENYRKYAVRWKNAASMVRPLLTSREENFMFVDTLPSPYYDLLVVNAFVEFRDLMYFMGRIEEEIRRGKIMKTGASMMEKKRISPDRRVQTVFGERESKRRSHITREELVKNHPRSPWYAQVPMTGLHSP